MAAKADWAGTAKTMVLLSLLALACGGRTPLAGVGSGSSAPGSNPPWTPPAADGSCPDGTSPCGLGTGTKCYALDHDARNCGRCDETCMPGIACAGGVCQQAVCAGPLALSPPATTAQSTPVWPRNTAADMNGDGRLDLVEWSDGGALRISLGNGDGTFAPAASYPAWQAAESYVMDQFVVVGDFNEDGNPDLAVSVPGRNYTVDIWPGNGDGTLQARSPRGGQPSSTLVAGDVNRDGHLDVVINNVNTRTIVVLLGRGDGTLSKSATISPPDVPVEIVIRDWDGDGIPDLLSMGSNLSIVMGLGSGLFAKPQDCGISVDLRQTIIADFNGDGKQDVATPLYPNHAVSVMLGNGGCAFSPRADYPTPSTPYLLVSGDVTGDGILDLVECDASNTNSHLMTLVGEGDGTFIPSAEWTGSGATGDILVGDYDGDGRVDVLVSDDEGVHVQRNTCP